MNPGKEIVPQVRHLALFFRGSKPDTLFWVRAPVLDAAALDVDMLIGLVLAADATLECVHVGSTEYGIDEQYFAEEGRSKRLLFDRDCHLTAYAEAFGGNRDELDADFVRRHTLKIGSIADGRFNPCEPQVVDRVAVTPTTIPQQL